MPSRNERITQLFTALHQPLKDRVVRVVHTDPATIEDACSYAWQQLITHPVRLDTDHEPLSWMTTVAIREALRIASDERRADELTPEGERLLTGPESVEAAVFGRARLRALRCLPERQRRLLLLQAAGYSYAELVAITGYSYRTIDRQLRRAHRAATSRPPTSSPRCPTSQSVERRGDHSTRLGGESPAPGP